MVAALAVSGGVVGPRMWRQGSGLYFVVVFGLLTVPDVGMANDRK